MVKKSENQVKVQVKQQHIKQQNIPSKSKQISKKTPKQSKPSIVQQNQAPKVQSSIKDKSKQKNKGKRNRLIIRNLIFDVNSKHLRKLLQPFGEIVDLQVPTNPNNQKLNKGFAFVEYKSHRSCEKAIKELNQTKYKGRPIVLDFSLSKVKFMTNQMGKQDKGEEVQQENNKQQEAQQQQQDMKNEQQAQDQNNQQQEQQQQQQNKQERPQQDLSFEIFIRNVPITATQQQLKQFFSKYGRVKWAKVVIDKQTGASKGTAFVKYLDNQHAKALIQYSRSYQMFLLGKNQKFKPNPRINLQLDGTIMKVFPVQTRAVIGQKLRQRQQKQTAKGKLKPLKKIRKLRDLIAFDRTGKRRLALAQHGLWQPSDQMLEEDRSRFLSHSREKIQKLKNPNNVVSDTRVILKYLDRDIGQQQIKDLVFQFLRYYQLPTRQLTYCKLMLQADRQRSAGFGFVEFRRHQNALRFVQKLSQSPSVLSKRPFVVQFAIQDSRKMQKLKGKQK